MIDFWSRDRHLSSGECLINELWLHPWAYVDEMWLKCMNEFLQYMYLVSINASILSLFLKLFLTIFVCLYAIYQLWWSCVIQDQMMLQGGSSQRKIGWGDKKKLNVVATGIATGRRTEKENRFKKRLESPPQLFLKNYGKP